MRKVRFGQKSRPRTYVFRKNNPITTVDKTCILCLEEMTTKERMNYSTSDCACKPQIHEACFNEWNRRNPGSCPICRKTGSSLKGSKLEARGVPAVSSGSNDWTGIGCILGCCSIMNIIDALSN